MPTQQFNFGETALNKLMTVKKFYAKVQVY